METIVQENIRLRNELFNLRRRIRTSIATNETSRYCFNSLPKDYFEWERKHLRRVVSEELEEFFTYKTIMLSDSQIITASLMVVMPEEKS